jgi:hypothetical protein
MRSLRLIGDFMRLLLFVVGVLAVPGCSDSMGPAATFQGTYDLVSLNGAPPPWLIANSSTERDDLLGDVITANGDGILSETTALGITSNGITNSEFVFRPGTYTINGSAVTIELEGVVPVTGTGTASGTTLILPSRAQIVGEARYVRRQ